MKDGPAFQMYSDLFYIDTAEWEPFEVGIYTRLLMCEWANGSLPQDEKKLARLSGTTPKKFQKAFKIVKEKFHVNGNGRLINFKMEEVREKQRQYRDFQRQKGKKSAEKRWHKDITTVITTVEPVLQPDVKPEGNSSSSSSFKKKEIIKKEKNVALFFFEKFWQSYPKKKSKGQAEKTWNKINPDENLLNQILLSIEKAKNSPGWLEENGKYIPHPSTWLNAKGWEDEIIESDDPYKNFPILGGPHGAKY